MTDDAPPDARLRATEVQMRRALGLGGEPSPQPAHSPNSPNGLHPQRRHFVRDGEVPVTVIHRHNGHDISHELDSAKQDLLAQTTAREQAERALADARSTIHDLETKLGHERFARDEVTQRINAERLQIEEALTAMQEELATERALRAVAERERDEATVATRTAEQRQRTTVKAAQLPPAPFPSDQPRRRRGRPPKVARQDIASDDSEIVEWWSPGWQEKYR